MTVIFKRTIVLLNMTLILKPDHFYSQHNNGSLGLAMVIIKMAMVIINMITVIQYDTGYFQHDDSYSQHDIGYS